MAKFLVTVSSELPYKIEKEFIVSGWDFSTAVSRASRLYRDYLREDRGKAKKIKTLSIKATRL
jgi:hypothetical protein